MKKGKIILALFLLCILGIFGCGKKSENSGSSGKSVTASKDYVYRMEDVASIPEGQNINQIIHSDKGIYAYGYNWLEDTQESTLVLFELNEDGTRGETYEITLEGNVSINALEMDDNGDLYCIVNRYQTEGEIEEDYARLEEETASYDEYFLVKMTLIGEKIFAVKLNDIPEIQKLSEENGYLYIRNMILDPDTGIYLSVMEDSFIKFDMDGNFLKMTKAGGGNSSLFYANFIRLKDGRMVAVLNENENVKLGLVDLETGTIEETYSFPGLSYEYTFYQGEGYDLYLTNMQGLYGYNLGDADKTQLLSFVDSDFEFYSLYCVTGINEKQFYAIHDDMYSGMSTLAKFTKVEPEEIKDKQQITLAMVYTDWRVRQAVINFNKTNEEYRISIIDYNSLYGSSTDYKAGYNKLNTDIVSGKVPDLLVLDNSLPVDSYINKGLFEDLKPYIEKDEEFKLDQFMPNIVEAFSVDGKLYTLVPSYTIQTLVAKASDVGNERGWTIQEAMDIMASKPQEMQFANTITREGMLNSCMSMAGSQFIDWEKGNCNFNSDAFIQMLDFLKMFPEEIDDSTFTDEYWMNYDSMWREGKVLTYQVGIGSFRDYNNLEKGTFGEDITMIGFPSADEDGSVITPDLQFAMSAKSGCKDGAWAFLRTFLTDEYQTQNVTYSFPISIKRLDALAEEAMQKPYYMDENNSKVEFDDTYYVGGVEITISPMTEQETEELKKQLYSFTQVYKYDEALLNIIQEETAPYFAGQKNARDVAAIIQSRAQIYVNENR